MLRFLAFVALVVHAGCAEQQRVQFASGAKALQSDTAKRGWVPQWLPADAINVDLRYDLDTNERWLSFRLDPEAAVRFQQQLRSLAEQEILRLELRRPRGDGQWPDGIIQLQPANDAALFARIFSGTGTPVPKSTSVAFEHGSTNVYAWIPRD